MYIQNTRSLATTKERKDILSILESGLESVKTERVISELVRTSGEKIFLGEEDITPEKGGRLFVFGVGKCALHAGQALEGILGESIAGGVMLDVSKNDACSLSQVECFVGSHPFPSEANIIASKRIVEVLKETNEKDTVLFVVSGGGSTLLYVPEASHTCFEEVDIVRALMYAGASIKEINTVRKHLSEVRGGNIARYAYPSRLFALIFSDVPGDDIRSIASGPTVLDETTTAEAVEVLTRYGVLRSCGLNNCGLIETPKEKKYFERVKNILVVSNIRALLAMKARGEALGYKAEVCSSCLTGEAKEVARDIIERLHTALPRTLLLYGGETTVKVFNKGEKGGRNQELALAALQYIQKNETLVAFASDGRDNTETAGAIADSEILSRANELGLSVLESLQKNRSYDFFIQTKGAIITGETGINIADLTIAVKGERSNE